MPILPGEWARRICLVILPKRLVLRFAAYRINFDLTLIYDVHFYLAEFILKEDKKGYFTILRAASVV